MAVVVPDGMDERVVEHRGLAVSERQMTNWIAPRRATGEAGTCSSETADVEHIEHAFHDAIPR
jgi:hypothetical protein